jgi:hypothetical protein
MMLVTVLAVVVAAGLAALAWWASGRSRAGVQLSLADRERAENDVRALRQHRPHSSAPLGPLG